MRDNGPVQWSAAPLIEPLTIDEVEVPESDDERNVPVEFIPVAPSIPNSTSPPTSDTATFSSTASFSSLFDAYGVPARSLDVDASWKEDFIDDQPVFAAVLSSAEDRRTTSADGEIFSKLTDPSPDVFEVRQTSFFATAQRGISASTVKPIIFGRDPLKISYPDYHPSLVVESIRMPEVIRPSSKTIDNVGRGRMEGSTASADGGQTTPKDVGATRGRQPEPSKRGVLVDFSASEIGW